MIKVLQVGATNVLGGIEIFLHNYYKNIDRNKVKFDFVNMYDKICFQEEYEENGSRVYNLPNYRIHPFKYLKQLSKILKDEKYDVLHFNMNSAIFLYPLMAAKKANVPVIIAHSHNSSSDKGIIKNILHDLIKHFITLFANYFFACSDYAGKWFFSDKVMKSDSFYIINNAINVEEFKFNEAKRIQVRKDLNIKDNEILIGHVGRFIKQKNHKFLIDIFDQIVTTNKKFKLVLIGVGELKKEIEKKVQNLGIDKNVIFLGQRNDTKDLYQAIDVFLLPSLYEGLPLVGIEAQVAGCICFFSKNITEEVKIKENTRFIKIDNSKIWASEILKCKVEINNNNRYTLGFDKFNIKNNVKKLEILYNKLLGSKK
ncbi:MAG: glycosyltransferase family 1 protein [Bacilli bacterium]|nr:glycosyltransferase family 1 protein [Bacilli bacterium]